MEKAVFLEKISSPSTLGLLAFEFIGEPIIDGNWLLLGI
jgi:hypothetical protein|tara:strand:+ start:773 stop:889 length:117 start_codon:yes stop_codon:yes gene_type:complete